MLNAILQTRIVLFIFTDILHEKKENDGKKSKIRNKIIYMIAEKTECKQKKITELSR